MTNTNELLVRNGVLIGPLRQSVNSASQVKGSIHDDATASKLGFRGGTVAGIIHMELFPPLLLRAFGQRWFERGTLSMYFVNATTDRESVRAYLKQPHNGADTQVEAWVERENGATMRVAEGTASVGDCVEPTALQQRLARKPEASELRMFKTLKAGDELPEVKVRLAAAEQARRLDVITEKLDWYVNESPWGKPIATPTTMNQLLYAKSVEVLRPLTGGAVGLFGAIELRNINGPVLVDEPYRVKGKVLAVGDSPKTEYLWFETTMRDANDKNVAGLVMLLRFMKASSSLYQ